MEWIDKIQIHFDFFSSVASPASSPLWHEDHYSSSLIELISVSLWQLVFVPPPFSEARCRNSDMKWGLPAEAVTSVASFGNKPRVWYCDLSEKKNPHHHRWKEVRFHLCDVFSVSLSREHAAALGLRHHQTSRIHQSGKCLVNPGTLR